MITSSRSRPRLRSAVTAGPWSRLVYTDERALGLTHARAVLPPTDDPARSSGDLERDFLASLAGGDPATQRSAGVSTAHRTVAGRPVLAVQCLPDASPAVVASLLAVVQPATVGAGSPAGRASSRPLPRTPRKLARATCAAARRSDWTGPMPQRPTLVTLGEGLGEALGEDLDEALGEALGDRPVRGGGGADAAAGGPAAPGQAPPLRVRIDPDGNPVTPDPGDADREAWLCARWNVATPSPGDAAAVLVLLDRTAGGPDATLFRLLRERHGLSYGPRYAVRPTAPRTVEVFVEFNVPAAAAAAAWDHLEQAIDAARRETRRSGLAAWAALARSVETRKAAVDAAARGWLAGDAMWTWDVLDALRDEQGPDAHLPTAEADQVTVVV